jgi:hypothetical protein
MIENIITRLTLSLVLIYRPPQNDAGFLTNTRLYKSCHNRTLALHSSLLWQPDLIIYSLPSLGSPCGFLEEGNSFMVLQHK